MVYLGREKKKKKKINSLKCVVLSCRLNSEPRNFGIVSESKEFIIKGYKHRMMHSLLLSKMVKMQKR